MRRTSTGLLAALCSLTLSWITAAAAWADPVSYVEVGSIGSPGGAVQLLYSSPQQKLVLRNGGSAVRVVNLTDGSTQTVYSTSLFTDMSLSPSGRYAFVADYGYENIGYGTPNTPSHVVRIDLQTGDSQSKDASGAIAYHVEAVDDDHFVLTSLDQWITFTYDSWGTGTGITGLSPTGSYWPGYYAGVYGGDIEFDRLASRVIHCNAGLSSQEITAFKVANNTFTPQETSGTYGTASGQGGSCVIAVDSSAVYYGKLQVDPLDVSHNRRVFAEVIQEANGRAAFGNGKYYDPATGALLGSLGFGTTVYATNISGDDFWAYDGGANMLRHFYATDGPIPAGPQANPDLFRTGPTSALDLDVLANDFGFNDPLTVEIDAAPGHGTATVVGSPGAKSGIRIHYVPTPGYLGPDSLSYAVSDGTNTGSATVNITVDSFRAYGDTYFVPRNSGSSALFVAGNDVGFGDPVTLKITSPPSGGYAYVYSSPGSTDSVYIYYSPNYGSTDDYTDSFSYEISDGTHTDTASVTVEVVAIKAVDDAAITNVGTPVAIDVLQNDVLGYSNTTLGMYQTPLHGIVTQDYYYGELTYTPEPGFLGTDSFVYAIDDGQHLSYGTVTVNVIHDQDGDKIADEVDNCVAVANSDQRDTDGDGYGNMCDGDLNNDGIVNAKDLAAFRLKFGTSDPNADLDGNGFVSFQDLALFRLMFYKAPGPSGLHPL